MRAEVGGGGSEVRAGSPPSGVRTAVVRRPLAPAVKDDAARQLQGSDPALRGQWGKALSSVAVGARMLGGASGAGTVSGRRVQPGRVMPWTPQAVRKGLSRGTGRALASRTFSPGGPRGPGSPLGPPRPLGPSGPSSPRGPGGPISPYRWESKGEGDATVPSPAQAGSEGLDPRPGVGAAGEPLGRFK